MPLFNANFQARYPDPIFEDGGDLVDDIFLVVAIGLLTAACEGACDVLSPLGGAGADLGAADALETSAAIGKSPPRRRSEHRAPADPQAQHRLDRQNDDLLRLAGSLKFRHATASLLVGKLSASGRQNALAAALTECGASRRTIYAARHVADPAYRRKISRQLNKGESLHALKRDLICTREGTVRARHLEAQTEQAWCLTLVTNAVVAWTTEYCGLAVESMRTAGRRIDDEVLARSCQGSPTPPSRSHARHQPPRT
ncbi:Tn3 family transposase [Amycolatopsis sp. NPDC023774]|uniref:Tn3 family transposase n=1 Tax=Amycolatopsis sp. NPDC023774 TaxID=3155015 RepID=UPI0033EA9D82